jgi:hypothetical protein
MKKSILVFALLMATTVSIAQDLQTNENNKREVSKLGFMVGDWKGSGWMMMQDGQKHSFIQTENIRFKLDSTALLIEGLGYDNGKIIHNALAVVTFQQNDNRFSFQSYLSNGRQGKFNAELKDDKFYWYPMENMRYVISLNEKGQWFETGEMKRGEQWFQFFEMTLDRL